MWVALSSSHNEHNEKINPKILNKYTDYVYYIDGGGVVVHKFTVYIMYRPVIYNIFQ